jgi:glycosyltransferase involved in cell wall biosynthesis
MLTSPQTNKKSFQSDTKNSQNQTRSLLYIDMAYTVSRIKARKHEDFFHARHAGGYFKKVWGVHPLSDVGGGNDTSQIQFTRLSPRQLIIEGVAENMLWPRIFIPLNFLISQLFLLVLLVRLVRKHDISAIHATDPYYGGLLGLCLKIICRKPLVISIWGNYDDVYIETGALAMPRLFRWRGLEKICERVLFFAADLVIGGNKDMVRFALNNGARKQDCVELPTSIHMHQCHFVDPKDRVGWQEAFNHLNIPLGKSYLLYVGRLISLKHVDDAVKAMKIVIEHNVSTIGIMAGEGTMREELEQYVDSAGLKNKIIFLGNVDQKTLSKLFPKCITLSPLTGMALVEAGLGGSPVVAYDRDWQADFIQDEVNGFIVKFRDYEEMGKKALQLVQDQELRCRFSSEILKTALDFADLDKIFKNQGEMYEKMFENFYATTLS